MRLLYILAIFDAHKLRHGSVHHLMIILALICLHIRHNTQFNELGVSHIIKREEVSTRLFNCRAMFLQRIFGNARQHLTRTMTEAFVQIHVYITHVCTIFLCALALYIREHKLLVETISKRSLVICLS